MRGADTDAGMQNRFIIVGISDWSNSRTWWNARTNNRCRRGRSGPWLLRLFKCRKLSATGEMLAMPESPSLTICSGSEPAEMRVHSGYPSRRILARSMCGLLIHITDNPMHRTKFSAHRLNDSNCLTASLVLRILSFCLSSLKAVFASVR